MPLYFFLSGLFFKEYEGFLGFLLRKINKLLIPFCFFYIITCFLYPNILLSFGITDPHTESLGIQGLWAFIIEGRFTNGPLWFLWCLFIVNIIFYLCVIIVKKISASSVWQATLLAFFCFTIGMINSLFIASHINILGFVDSAIAALPFFSVGYIFNKFTDILRPNAWDKYLPVLIIVCFALTFIFGGRCSYMHNVFHINPIAQHLCGITGTLFIIFFAKIIQDLPLISYWGRYSIMILVSHQLLLQILSPLFRKVPINIPLKIVVLLGVVMFSYQFLIPLMKKYLPYVTAQKDVINLLKFVKQ
jgi:fucose 4-O-acetylase-like acetyltransferase